MILKVPSNPNYSMILCRALNKTEVLSSIRLSHTSVSVCFMVMQQRGKKKKKEPSITEYLN